MKKRVSFGSELTLLELIIVIGFFAVFAVTNLHIFSSARQICEESNGLGHAVIAAENAAECFKSGCEPTLYYAEDWTPSKEQDAEYILTLETSCLRFVRTAFITVRDKNGGELFALTVKTPEEVAQ